MAEERMGKRNWLALRSGSVSHRVAQRGVVTAAAASVACSFVQSTAMATAPTTWMGTNSNVWTDPGNWSAGVPLNTTQPTIFNSAPANMSPTFTAATNVQQINIQAGAGSFAISGAATLNWFIPAGGIALQMDSGVTTNQSISANVLTPRNNATFLNESPTALLTFGAANWTSSGSGFIFTYGGAGDTLITGVIGNSNQSRINGVTKTGAGTVTLSGNSIYGLNTTVNAGTMVLNGALGAAFSADPITGLPTVFVAAPSNVVVTPTGNLATFAGMGHADGSITVGGAALNSSQLAVLSPGDYTTAGGSSVGTMTANNNVTFGNYGELNIQINGDSSDLLNIAGNTPTTAGTVVTGNLNLSSSLDELNITLTGAQTLSRYVFATYAGTLTGTFDIVNISGASGATVDYSVPGQIAVTFVPEPVGLSLCGLAIGGLLIRRQRFAVKG